MAFSHESNSGFFLCSEGISGYIYIPSHCTISQTQIYFLWNELQNTYSNWNLNLTVISKLYGNFFEEDIWATIE